MEVGGQRHAPADLPTGKRPSTHGIGGCVGPRAGLDRFGENIPHAGWGGGGGFDPRTAQSVINGCVWVRPLPVPTHLGLRTGPLCTMFCTKLEEPCSFTIVPDGPYI